MPRNQHRCLIVFMKDGKPVMNWPEMHSMKTTNPLTNVQNARLVWLRTFRISEVGLLIMHNMAEMLVHTIMTRSPIDFPVAPPWPISLIGAIRNMYPASAGRAGASRAVPVSAWRHSQP